MSQPVEAIERTPEYEEFMRQLREFHERKGTTLQAEPVLGGKKLDLLKIYKIVMEAGGYEKVTQNRGWKQVGDPFDFPPTCTNSAYILKAVYIKNLLGWEEENVWKRPWNPPKEHLEGGPKSHKHSSPLPPDAGPIKPKNAARQTATAFTQQPQPVPRNKPLPQPLPQLPAMPFIPQPFSAIQTTPEFHHQFAVFMDEELRSRILLALKSTLPNEIDWAFNVLVRFSFGAENFSLDYAPPLLDDLITFAEPFFEQHIKSIDESSCDHTDFFSSKKSQETMERVLQVFHIIRNFSFVEHNIRRLAQHQKLRQMLMMGVSCLLSANEQYAELGRHCLDILENIAPQVVLNSPSDPYLVAMTRLLFTNDRALILGAIRALTRVAVTEINERVLSKANNNADIIRRVGELLLVDDDEELTAAILEYLYQLSSLEEGKSQFGIQLVQLFPGGNLIGLLTGYLSYKSSLAASNNSLNATIHGIPAALNKKQQQQQQQQTSTPPTIPDLTDYANLDEPYRCLGWLKEKLVKAGEEDTMALKQIFSEYLELFGSEKPLAVKEFYTVLKIAFPQPASVEQSVANSSNTTAMLNDVVLRNIKYAPPKEPEKIQCEWKECTEAFENSSELHAHIVSSHLKANESGEYSCQWMNCGRHGFRSQSFAKGHLRTHFVADTDEGGTEGKIRKKKVIKKRKKNDHFVVDKIPVDEADVSGVPLTAALLLRNLAKYRQHHIYYVPYESELTCVAIQRPKLAKYILTVLEALHV